MNSVKISYKTTECAEIRSEKFGKKELIAALLAGSAVLCALTIRNATEPSSLVVASPLAQRTVAARSTLPKRITTTYGSTANLPNGPQLSAFAPAAMLHAQERSSLLTVVLAPLISAIGAAVAVYKWNSARQKEETKALTIDWTDAIKAVAAGPTAMFATAGEKVQMEDMYGASRKLFLGPLSDGAPAWLKGEMAGDYGFDPLSLGENAVRLERYRQGEIINGRWAMLGTLGCLTPELLQKYAGFNYPEPVWFKSGAAIFGGSIDYLNNPNLVHAQSIFAILAVEAVLIGVTEAFRVGGGPLGQVTGDPVYPGKAFDPLGMSKDPEAFAELKVKEVKNGRLAMLGMLGYFMQAFATGKGPVQNWADHIADPATNNIISFHWQVLSQYTGGSVAML